MKIQMMGGKITENLGFKSSLRKVMIFLFFLALFTLVATPLKVVIMFVCHQMFFLANFLHILKCYRNSVILFFQKKSQFSNPLSQISMIIQILKKRCLNLLPGLRRVVHKWEFTVMSRKTRKCLLWNWLMKCEECFLKWTQHEIWVPLTFMSKQTNDCDWPA